MLSIETGDFVRIAYTHDMESSFDDRTCWTSSDGAWPQDDNFVLDSISTEQNIGRDQFDEGDCNASGDSAASLTTGPLFIGCDDGMNAGEFKADLEQIEPEQIVIKVEPGLEGMMAASSADTDANCSDPGQDGFEEKFKATNFREPHGLSSSDVNKTDKNFAAKIKQAFGSLSSRFLDASPTPSPLSINQLQSKDSTVSEDIAPSRIREIVVGQKEKCLNELLRLFPSIDYMEVLDVLVRHRWALGVSVRHLKSKLKLNALKLPLELRTAPVAVEPVRHVISSFSVDHKREAAHKIEIKEKEKCLHELGTIFPMLDCLELQNVLVNHRWSVESSVNYLQSNLGTNVQVRPKHGKCFKLFKSSDNSPDYPSTVNQDATNSHRGDIDCGRTETDKDENLPTDLADKIKRAFSSLSSGLNNLEAKPIIDRFRLPDKDNGNDDVHGTIDIKQDKEKRLSELVALFPDINILILYDVIVRQSWSVEASTDYLNSRKMLVAEFDGDHEQSVKNSNGVPRRKAAIAATRKLAVWNSFESDHEEFAKDTGFRSPKRPCRRRQQRT